jgi:hypothetical protein
LYVLLPTSNDKAKFEIDDISKQKIADFVKSNKFNKIGLLSYSSELDKYYLAIPLTTKSIFINLSQSKNLILDVSYMKEVRRTDFEKWHVLDFTSKGSALGKVVNKEQMNFDYLNNWIDIPFIKVYLLILLMVLVSSELILKLKIIKI